MENTQPVLNVSDAIAVINQTLEYAYPSIVVQGEVSSFKVNQGKYVFFDLKDESGTLNCFMSLFQLRTQIEDGMRVQVVAVPKLTAWGRFSLTVRSVEPVGEGNIKRAFELLHKKLQAEGLFDEARKRQLPQMPARIGVISSTQAAGYADFVKIISERWGGVELVVAHTLVQGVDAPNQMIRALEYFNSMAEPVEIVAILRGGGSADDLAAFNDEPLVRAIASSRIPTIVGVGHEVDTTLADLAADVRAATPSNAAQIIVPDKREVHRQVKADVFHMGNAIESYVQRLSHDKETLRQGLCSQMDEYQRRLSQRFSELQAVLVHLNPRTVLRRGYAIVLDKDGSVARQISVGETIQVETHTNLITAGVTHVTKKHSE